MKKFRCLLLILFSCLTGTTADEQEYRLTRYLMANYDTSVRPSRNSSEPIDVQFDLALHNIADLNERDGILSTNCLLTQIWIDAHLTWNSSDFSGINIIRIPYDKVWRPDIVLYNNAVPELSLSSVNTNVIVKSSGEVTWISYGTFKSSCNVDMRFFPFDTQQCDLKWSSWTYDGLKLNLIHRSDRIEMTHFKSSNQFDLIQFSMKRNVQFNACCSQPYADITYTLLMKRRSMFHVLNLILPCFLINLIALFAFFVPNQSGEKLTLGISALIAMTIFFISIRDSLSPAKDTPILSIYFASTICLVSFSSLLSVVTLNLHHKGANDLPLPKTVRKVFFDFLGKIGSQKYKNVTGRKNTFLGTCALDSKPDVAEKYHNDITFFPGENLNFHLCHLANTPSTQSNTLPLHTDRPMMTDHICWARELEEQLSKVLSRVQEVADKHELYLQDHDKRKIVKSDWNQVALICDRIMLGVFLLITIILLSLLTSYSML